MQAIDVDLQHMESALAGIIHEADSAFFSDCSDNSTGVRVCSFASYTLTWICGYFFLSSRPTFIAAAELSYSDLNLPSTSRILVMQCSSSSPQRQSVAEVIF